LGSGVGQKNVLKKLFPEKKTELGKKKFSWEEKEEKKKKILTK
jgi:hypothetical protein